MSYTTIHTLINTLTTLNYNYRRYNDHTSGKKKLRHSIRGEN